MSKVSFLNTDITQIRFNDSIRWRGRDNFQIIEETWLEENAEENSEEGKKVRLGGVLSVYRNLRENYEYRRRYDESGKFFIREMDLKRKYRGIKSKGYDADYKEEIKYNIKKKNWLERHIFSLTGLYYHLSRYGEDLLRPTLAGFVIVIFATFFFVCQSNPILEPTLPFYFSTFKTYNNTNILNSINNAPRNTTASPSTTSTIFIGLAQITNGSHWSKAVERGLGDFLPLLSIPSDIKIGLIDYVIKIVGGAVTFGLIAIVLRRRFERKYTHQDFRK